MASPQYVVAFSQKCSPQVTNLRDKESSSLRLKYIILYLKLMCFALFNKIYDRLSHQISNKVLFNVLSHHRSDMIVSHASH